MIRYRLFFLLILFSAKAWGQDTIPPTLTLKGEPGATVCKWMPYKDAGYSFVDSLDNLREITVEIEGTFKNTDSLGLFHLRYKATDKAGDYAYSERRVIIVVCEDGLCHSCRTIGVIENKNFSSATLIFPNPTTGELTIRAKGILSMTDITGKQIPISPSKVSPTIWHLSLSGNRPGLYLLYIQTESGTSVRKIYLR